MLAIKFLILLILAPFVMMIPRNRKKIIFGAWGGNRFADNPKYFLKYILANCPQYECYWFGNERIKNEVESLKGVRFVRKGSLASCWHALTAGWAVWNISYSDDISRLPNYRRIRQLTFWHGPAFKGVKYLPKASDEKRITSESSLFKCMTKFVAFAQSQRAYASFSTQFMVKTMKYEAPLSFDEEHSRAFGSARNDYLIKCKNDTEEIKCMRIKYSRMLGLPLDKEWYLYMPTWRKGLALKYSFLKAGVINDYQKILSSKNAIIIEKQHPKVMEELHIQPSHVGDIYAIADPAGAIDTQELMMACGRLITDYSSCSVDFMTLDRPVLYFMYDYDSYMKERGTAFNIEDVVAGPIAKSDSELLEYLKMDDALLLKMKAKGADALVSGETGHACELFSKWVGLI